MAALASDWLKQFSISPLKMLNGIQQNLTGSKISTSSNMFVLFGPISKQKKMAALADSSKKVAHYTQVHDMWPFWPIVYAFIVLR